MYTSQHLCSTSQDLVHQRWHIRLYIQRINIYLIACPQDLTDCLVHVQGLRNDSSFVEQKRGKSYSATAEYIFSCPRLYFSYTPCPQFMGLGLYQIHSKYSVNNGRLTHPTHLSFLQPWRPWS